METTFIYGLVDPRTDEIRYIGKANDIRQRLKNHLNPARYRPTHKFNWIRKLRRLNMKPYLIILDEVPINDWKFWEKFWIQLIKSWGFNLVNHTEGGEGLTYGNQTSFKKGNIPWNNGTLKPKILKGNRGKTIGNIKNHFKTGSEPWNKNISNYKLGGLKTSRHVLQIDKESNKIINEYLGCKEAAKAMNCIPENIRRACVGKSKSAKGYKWKYNDK